MAIKFWLAGGIVAVTAAAFACSNSSGGAGGGGGSSSCLSQEVGAACLSCVQANCPSVVTNYESGCSDYLGCICPGGTFSCSAQSSNACQTAQQESACATANSAGAACATQYCPQCKNQGSQCSGDAGGD
jgi:hypothetical protein